MSDDDVEEWELYELLNRRSVATYALEADEEFFIARSQALRASRSRAIVEGWIDG